MGKYLSPLKSISKWSCLECVVHFPSKLLPIRTNMQGITLVVTVVNESLIKKVLSATVMGQVVYLPVVRRLGMYV